MHCLRLFFVALAWTTGATAWAAGDDEVDHLGLASMMIRDGHPDRAVALLAEVDPLAAEIDLVRFYTLRGLARLQVKQNEAAIGDLEQALSAGQTDAIVHVYLAQANFALAHYDTALAEIDFARKGGSDLLPLTEMEAECHWRLGDKERAWEILVRAEAASPHHVGFLRRRFFYAIDLGLFALASELGQTFLAVSDGSPKDTVAISRALFDSGKPLSAAGLLEAGLLRHGGNRELGIELARVYLEIDRPLAAAVVLERHAILDADLSNEAADLYRRAKQPERALRLNVFVADPKERLRQRLALLIDANRFEMVAAMQQELRRARLLDDEQIVYALAYSLFRAGDYAEADRYLANIKDPEAFAKAMSLRRIMQDCVAEPWVCAND